MERRRGRGAAAVVRVGGGGAVNGKLQKAVNGLFVFSKLKLPLWSPTSLFFMNGNREKAGVRALCCCFFLILVVDKSIYFINPE